MGDKVKLENASKWPALLCTIDFQGRFKYVNAVWQQLGIADQSLLTTTFTHWLHPEDIPTVQTRLTQLFTGEQTHLTFESRWRDKKGEYRWLLWSVTVCSAEQLIYAVGIEIAAQKQEEERLRASEQRYRTLVDHLPVGVLGYDAHNAITFCNTSATQLLNLTAEQLLGENSWNWPTVRLNGQVFSEHLHPAAMALHTSKFIKQKMGVQCVGQQLKWLDVSAQPVADKALPFAVVSTFTDISSDKKKEDVLQDSVTLLSSIFNVANIGIAITNDEGQFVRVNAAYCKLYGYEINELLGQSFTLLLPATVRKEALQHHAAFLADTASHSGVWAMRHKNGTIFNSQVSESKIQLSEGRRLKITYVITLSDTEVRNLYTDLVYHQGLTLLLTHLPITALGLDRQGHLIFSQGPHLNQLGFKSQQVGCSLFEVAPQSLIPDLQRALDGEQFNKHWTQNGRRFQIHYLPLSREDKWVGVFIIFYDVTEQGQLKHRLKEALQELELLMPYTTLGTLTLKENKVTRFNPQCPALLGYTATELLMTPAVRLHPKPADYEQVRQHITMHFAHKDAPYQTQHRLRKKDGTVMECQLTVALLNKTRYMLWLIKTIQADEHTPLSLQAALWQAITEAVFVTDAKLHIQQANPMSTDFTGYTLAELMDKSLQSLDAGRQDDQFYTYVMETVNQQGQWQGSIWQRHKSGAVYTCQLKLQAYAPAPNMPKNQYIAILSHKQTNHSALLDPLTTLPSYGLFRYSLMKNHAIAQRYTKRFAILLLGIENMGDVNALYGCTTGDQLLHKVGQSLKSSVRESDTVARYNGGTFGVNLDGISKPQDAGLVSQMVLFKLTQPFVLNEHTLQAIVSIGVVVYPEDGNEIDTLLELAQAALQRAKELGGGQCCFHNPQLQYK